MPGSKVRQTIAEVHGTTLLTHAVHSGTTLTPGGITPIKVQDKAGAILQATSVECVAVASPVEVDSQAEVAVVTQVVVAVVMEDDKLIPIRLSI